MALVLGLCGILAATIGTWRGYAVAREAIGPFVHDGEETRRALDAARPLHRRLRLRLFARRTGVALAWTAVALYGLLLLEQAGAAR